MSEKFTSADLLLRIIAKILDFIIIVAVMEVVPKAGFFAGLAYLLIGDGLFDGRSLGKKLIGIKVISADTNKPCSFKDSILRNSTFGIGYLLYKIPWIGWIFIVIVSIFEFIILFGSKEGMRLGDEIAKTKVVKITNTDKDTLSRGT
ncbi:MAG: RDD family protein [Nitrospirota bacterium]|nr:RDD family protein [Nitrospirota bacterium]MDH5769405.1 RDD family protein [Nitrospirota bacterium]